MEVDDGQYDLKLIIMQLLTTFSSFLKSRQKILLKRRKVQLRNRPVSQKRLKEQQEVMNVSYEMKLVNIKQQLDRKKSQNHHINQIVEELFYPQVKLASEEEVEKRVKQLGAQGALFGENWEEELKSDDLMQEISKASLPMDLFAIHEQKWKEFTPTHYQKLMFRLSYYCNNRERIKQNTMSNWERLVKKMQETDGKAKLAKCPYLFLEKEEVMRHEHWGSLMKEIHRKISQIKDIKVFNEYLPVFLHIQKSFNSIPADIFQLVLTRNALANFQDLSKANISDLIKFMKYKNRVKYDPHIKIVNPDKETEQVKINHFARKLATDIISHPQDYTKDDFMNIFIVINTTKKRMNILTQQLLSKSENIITMYLHNLSFENVVTYITIYALFNNKPNVQFMEILKFDLYRKCQGCPTYHPILILMGYIKNRQLTFKNYKPKGVAEELITLQGFDLFCKLAESISKMMNKLKPEQILSLINSIFSNELKQTAILEVVSTEFVKQGKEYSLENLGKGFFKLTLLGHRSKILSRFVFEQFLSRYHSQVKRYKEEDNFLLPTEDNKQTDGLNLKLIHLQQCLIMVLWALKHQLGANLKNDISLDSLLTILPVKLDSMDPLCIELATIINAKLQVYSLFPKIQWLFVPNYFPMGRLKEFYKPAFSKSDVELLMWEQAQLCGKFIQNYNYSTNTYLGQRWSQVSVYSQQKYLQFCLQSQKSKRSFSFFDKAVTLPQSFLAKRREKLALLAQRKPEKSSKFFKNPAANRGKDHKFYDLLI